MTTPAMVHRPGCSDQTLRCSGVPFNRTVTRWRCLGCGVTVDVPATLPTTGRR